MNNLKQKYKDYLIKNEIKDLTDLVNYVEILRNTSNLQGEDRQMLFDFAFLITNEQLPLKSFFAETKSLQNKNPSKEFYNAFKQNTSSPTFMDEVLEQSNKEKWNPLNELHERAGREMFNTIKDEDGQFNSTRQGETHTEVPNFEVGYTQTTGYKDTEKFILLKLNKLPKYKETDDKELLNDYVTKIIGNNPPFRTVEGTERQGEFATMEEMFSKVGKKEKEGKLFYELDFEFIKQMAERMQSNKDNSKYELWNWKKPLSEKDLEELKQAMWRHIIAVMSGELEDDGRPFGHLEAISNNAMMINYQLKLKKC